MTEHSSPRNPGLVVLNRPRDALRQKTVIILGVARSGTSMAAGALDRLGVYMGERRKDVFFEDLEIARHLETPVDGDAFDRLVAERDRKFDIWGWKRPDAIKYVDRFRERVRNPYFIVTFRDVLSVAQRNAISIGGDVKALLRKAQNDYARVLDFVFGTTSPCLLVSYEKAVLNRETLIDGLVGFLELAPSREQRERALAFVENDRSAYLDLARPRLFRGALTRFDQGVIYGWAQSTVDSGPVTIDILVDGSPALSMVASRFRQDLKDRNIGNGCHGFQADITSYVSDGLAHVVRARVHADGSELDQSPLNVLWRPTDG